MRDNKYIWLDMDGTIANLYGVKGWLSDLQNCNVRPYVEAKPLYSMIDLIEVLMRLRAKGYSIGIISWLSKQPEPLYDMQVTSAKKEWLNRYCMDLVLDKVLITPYGVRKADTCRQYGMGILVDDEERNREEWDLGETINADKNIIEELRKLLDR